MAWKGFRFNRYMDLRQDRVAILKAPEPGDIFPFSFFIGLLKLSLILFVKPRRPFSAYLYPECKHPISVCLVCTLTVSKMKDEFSVILYLSNESFQNWNHNQCINQKNVPYISKNPCSPSNISQPLRSIFF